MTGDHQEMVHFPHYQLPSHFQFTEKQQVYKNIHYTQVTRVLSMQKKKTLTCLAAILEDPTTLPLLSSTSIPSDNSLCLIRPTLQMFALAEDGERKSQLTHDFN